MKPSFVVASIVALAAAGAVQATTVTRGPYLQMPTPASIIVRWRTDAPTDSRVRYGAAPGSLGSTADDPAPTTEHIVTVPALSADTRYYYAVGSVGGAFVGDDVNHFFRTPPTPGTRRATRIWVTGDGGFANASGQAVRDAYATYSAGQDTDLWLLLGDNAYVFGTDANYQAALFDMHHDLLRHVPVWPTFGNHEAFSSNSLTATGPYFDMFSLPTAAQAGGVASGTEAYYSFDHANMHFIVLDSQSASNAPGSPMMLWLEADLQATTADWVIAFWHHPPYSKGALHDSDVEANEINMRANVLPLLEGYGVDLVLCGHSHSYERSHLLDGHYGFSNTLAASMVLDSGDGDPAGDGAYRKASIAPTPHEGAVYVVAGSSSEVRTATLNHPVMEVGLLELGSLVLDVDGDTLRGTFLNSLVQTTDTFTLVKGPACPSSPRSGCGAASSGRLVVRSAPVPKLVWRWKGGTVDAMQVGAPEAQTDVAVCLYDQSGRLLGGAVSHGADPTPGTSWRRARDGSLTYASAAGTDAGIKEIRIKTGTGVRTLIRTIGGGASLALPSLPLAPPITAQLVNVDHGACWESVFTTTKRNESTRVLAAIP